MITKTEALKAFNRVFPGKKASVIDTTIGTVSNVNRALDAQMHTSGNNCIGWKTARIFFVGEILLSMWSDPTEEALFYTTNSLATGNTNYLESYFRCSNNGAVIREEPIKAGGLVIADTFVQQLVGTPIVSYSWCGYLIQIES